MILVLLDGDLLAAVDQHAAHERIRFEHFIKNLNAENIPMPFKSVFLKPTKTNMFEVRNVEVGNCKVLNPHEMQVLKRTKHVLNKLGAFVQVSENGEVNLLKTICLDGEILHSKKLTELFDNLCTKNNEDFELPVKIVERIRSFSCKNAIKFNDIISKQEAMLIVDDLALCDHPLFCIHGRNSVYPLKKINLEAVKQKVEKYLFE